MSSLRLRLREIYGYCVHVFVLRAAAAEPSRSALAGRGRVQNDGNQPRGTAGHHLTNSSGIGQSASSRIFSFFLFFLFFSLELSLCFMVAWINGSWMCNMYGVDGARVGR